MAGLRLTLDPTGVEAGAARVDKALAGVTGAAARADNALEMVGKEGLTAAKSVNVAANEITAVGQKSFIAGGGARMLSQQLSQVAQQGAVTGNYLGALAVQLPDIGLAFGAIGTAVGVLAMVGLPLLQQAMGDTSAASKRLDDALDSLDTAAENAKDSANALQAAYFGADETMRSFLETVAAADKIAAIKAMSNAVDALTDGMGPLFATNKGAPGGFLTPMGNALDLNVDKAKQLQGALDRLGSATGFDAQVKAANDLYTQLFAIYGTFEDMPPQVQDVAAALADAGISLDKMNAPAATLSSQLKGIGDWALIANNHVKGFSPALADAEGEAQDFYNTMDATSELTFGNIDAIPRGLGAAIDGANTLYGVMFDITQLSFGNLAAIPGAGDMFTNPLYSANGMAPPVPNRQPARSGGGGGGGAKSAVEAEIINLQELLDLQSELTNGWGDYGDAAGSAIDQLIAGTGDLKDVLDDTIDQMIVAIAKQTLLMSLGMSASTSGSIGSILVGALTGHANGGTIPVGSTGMVGENGPEPVTVTPYGAVVTSTSAQANVPASSAQAVQVEVGVTVDDDGGLQAYVKSIGTSAAKAGANMAVNTVKRSLGSWNSQLQTDGALV